MVIKILNLAKCLEKFGDIKNIDLTPEIIEATGKVQRTAKDLAPVSPTLRRANGEIYHLGGSLRDSIARKILRRHKSDVAGLVYTVIDYAIYQEFGTRYQSGTPFLRPAMNINRAGITQSMKKYIKEQLHKISNK